MLVQWKLCDNSVCEHAQQKKIPVILPKVQVASHN